VMGPTECAVLWTDPRAIGLEEFGLLDDVERSRVRRLHRPDDQARFVSATALLRRAVAAETGLRPSAVVLDRSCPTCGRPHGRPRLPGLDIHASIAHSGNIVGVALTRVGLVGLDVEELKERDFMTLGRHVLDSDEAVSSSLDFYRYWTRKEAVVKATGDGMAIGLSQVRVTGPDQPPRLLSYPTRPRLTAEIRDLFPSPSYPAALAVITTSDVHITQRWCSGDDPLKWSVL
jgi:4'-phosphopantetheinyl transferase